MNSWLGYILMNASQKWTPRTQRFNITQLSPSQEELDTRPKFSLTVLMLSSPAFPTQLLCLSGFRFHHLVSCPQSQQATKPLSRPHHYTPTSIHSLQKYDVTHALCLSSFLHFYCLLNNNRCKTSQAFPSHLCSCYICFSLDGLLCVFVHLFALLPLSILPERGNGHTLMPQASEPLAGPPDLQTYFNVKLIFSHCKMGLMAMKLH